ncbi:MAG: c-type cytochrome [Thiotrichales bacterium]
MRAHFPPMFAAVVLAYMPAVHAEKHAEGLNIGLACMGCHGTDGMSATAIPPMIKGLPADYFESALLDFKSGKRPSTIMGRIAKGFSDAEIKATAHFFASLK